MHRRPRVGGRVVRLPVLLFVCGMLAAPAPAPAALPAGTLTTFSESWAVPSEKSLKQTLAAVTGQCPRASASAAQLPPGITLPPGVTLPPGITLPPGVTLPTTKPGKLRKVSFAVALRRAQALGRAGKAGRMMARLSKRLKSEGDARGLAVAAVLGGSPRLVLGGLLAAYQRDPRDAMNLVNAAVPLTMLGRPAEALALLDRAAGGARAAAARPRLANPMGLSGRGVLENNRGYALLKLGRAAEAIAPLRRAIAAAGRPLAEAHSNLALALLCSGGSSAEAVKLIRKSYARRALTYLGPRTQLPGGLVELPESPWAKDVYDLEVAQETPLPQFKWPSTPEQSSNAVERMGAITAASHTRSSALSTEHQAVVERVNKLVERTPDKLERTAMVNAVSQSDNEPELGALNDRVLAAFQDVGAHTDAFWSVTVPAKQRECLASGGEFNPCFIPWCQSATASAQGGFNSRMALLDQLAREYWHRAGGRETAIVAHLEQPDYHSEALINMQQHGEALWSLLPSAAAGWVGATTFMKPLCVAGQEPAPDSPAVAANAADPGGCPPALSGKTVPFGTKVEIPPPKGVEKPSELSLKVKVGCDKLAVELSGKVKGTAELISIFGAGELDFKNDESTLVVGVKGKLPADLAGGQSGVYITTGKDGVKDYGWQVGAFVGANGLKAWGGTEKISLVGAIDYIPTAFNLR